MDNIIEQINSFFATGGFCAGKLMLIYISNKQAARINTLTS